MQFAITGRRRSDDIVEVILSVSDVGAIDLDAPVVVTVQARTRSNKLRDPVITGLVSSDAAVVATLTAPNQISIAATALDAVETPFTVNGDAA